MRLYLMRHGDAEPGGPGRPDAERRLTPGGVAAVRRQAVRFGAVPVRIFASPFLRARTTAELVNETLQVPLETAAALACGARLDDVAEVLDPHHPLQAALVVGHQPDLGNSVLLLTGQRVEMRPGTIAVVDVDAVRPEGGRLVSVWQPS